jgi:hypothetical protein
VGPGYTPSRLAVALLAPREVVFDGEPDGRGKGERVTDVCAGVGAMLLLVPVWLDFTGTARRPPCANLRIATNVLANAQPIG